ncbi:MAG: hypothetical protein GY820_48465 [Gammaproteobacteria bacterium]|nr:hypothetical protein [Gammaproteobacteria bacterium]
MYRIELNEKTTSGRPFKHSRVDTNETATYRASDLHEDSWGQIDTVYPNLHMRWDHGRERGKGRGYGQYGQKTRRPIHRNDTSRTHAQ